jgi:hypothetical protein
MMGGFFGLFQSDPKHDKIITNTQDVLAYVRNGLYLHLSGAVDLAMFLSQCPTVNGHAYFVPEACITKLQYDGLPENLQQFFIAKTITVTRRNPV